MSFCFDVAGNNIGQVTQSRAALGTLTSYSFKPMDYADKQQLFGKNIGFIAFIQDINSISTLSTPTSSFSMLSWIRQKSLTIVSPLYTQLNAKFSDPTAAGSISSFFVAVNKVVSSTERIPLSYLSGTYPRDSIVNGILFSNLEAGIRYSFLFLPTFPNGTINQGDLQNQFFGYGIVMCTCPPSSSDQTGSPIALSVVQKYGFVSSVTKHMH